MDEPQHKQRLPPPLIQDVAQLQKHLSHIREVAQRCDTALLGALVQWLKLYNGALSPLQKQRRDIRKSLSDF